MQYYLLIILHDFRGINFTKILLSEESYQKQDRKNPMHEAPALSEMNLLKCWDG